MNEYYEKIDWNFISSIVKDTVLPHMGTLTLKVILYLVLGFFLQYSTSFYYIKKST